MPRKTSNGWLWLFRCSLPCVALVAVTAGAWVWWKHVADRRMESFIAEMRAKGRLVRWRDLKIEDIPDSQNAAVAYRAAWSAQVVATSAWNSTTSLDFGKPGWRQMAEKEVAANATSLDLLHKARAYDRVNWGGTRTTPDDPPMPVFTNCSQFARLAAAAIVLRHQQGEDTQAIELWRDLDHMARMIGTNGHTLIQGLIAVIIDGISADTMMRIAPDLRIGRPGGLAPADARGLIGELLDVQGLKAAVAGAWRSGTTEAANFPRSSYASPLALPLRPGIFLCILRNAETCEMLADDCERLRYRKPSPAKPADPLPFDVFTPQFTSATSELIADVLRRRVAAMMVAVNLYRHEQGRFPAEMKDLVPSYLPAVPMDPRNEDKTPMGYLLGGNGDRPMIFSAGAEPSPGSPPKARADVKSVPQAGVQWQDVTSSTK